MSPDNPTQILTTHDLSNLRTLQGVTTATATTPITFSSNNTNNSNNHNSMVLSTIPLDGHALLIQQPQLIPSSAAVTITSNTQQHQRITIPTANGVRATNTNNASNNFSNLLAAATKATILNTNSGNTSNTAKISSSNNNSNGNMPTTSKYVFLQQNGNGQYTTYEGTSNNNSNNVGNIVLLATEAMEINGSNGVEQQHVIATTGDNDEELRPLAWLNDSNLIKGIVTTSAANIVAGSVNSNSINAKRNLGSNICIVNASSAHDLIEELPQHIACEEHVAAIGSTVAVGHNQNDLAETQITTLSVNDFQQQFMTTNKRYGGIVANSSQQLNSLGNFTLAQDVVVTSSAGNIAPRDHQHIYNNITPIGATTTVHVGPSGTTTVVEYKSNANFMPTQRQLLNNNSGVANTTTITSTNLSSNNNNNTNNTYVPSTTIASSTNHIPASLSISATVSAPTLPKQLALPNTIVTTTSNNNNNNNNNNNITNNNNNNVTNGNITTNTIYQGQKQQSSNSSSSSNVGSATHHPHKKYLREKMNVLDHGGGINTLTVAAVTATPTITIVSSPASSNNSISSSSSSSSTAAVNGDNSPVSKPFYGNAAVAINYSNSSNSSPPAFIATAIPSSTTSPIAASGMPAYTIVNQNQHVVSSPAMSSPEPTNSKDFYTLSTVQQQHHQQQQIQLQHNAIRSPTSYSSYDNDSLKDFEISTANSPASGARLTSTPQQQQQQQTNQKSSGHSNANAPQKQKHPNNVPYDPLIHTHNKPPYSFSSLIFMAIEGSTEKALPVKEIYAWIVQHFPYFKTAPTGWKNSVRHNLSLNKSFVKVEKAPNMGKGSLWRVEQQQRQNLIQALARSPFFPNSAVDKIALKAGGGNVSSNANAVADYDSVDGGSPGKVITTHINPRFDPRLFPNLSKAFKDMSENNVLSDVVADVPDEEIPSDYSTNNQSSNNTNNHNSSNSKYAVQNGGGGDSIMAAFSNYESMERLARDCGADSIDDVHAAAAMLALKHGPKVFTETFQNGAPVITSSPSEDHTYSAGGGSTAGSGSSTPLTNGNGASQFVSSTGNGIANGQQNGCDNQSNCASSDAAYESSEENHNITPEELVNQQRHRDGVDALLSLSLSSVIESSASCSPNKRRSSTSVEEEHISASMESNMSPPTPQQMQQQPQQQHHHHHLGKIALLSSAAANVSYSPHHHHQLIHDEGYNTQGFYGSIANHHHIQQLSSATPQKKPKPLRSLRTKIKRKAPWMR